MIAILILLANNNEILWQLSYQYMYSVTIPSYLNSRIATYCIRNITS